MYIYKIRVFDNLCIFNPKGLAPLSERIENSGAGPFGF
jgi:hypothetical protein